MATTAARPRLLIADDHAEMLAEVESLLSTEFDVAATAADGHTLVALALELRPDVIISDIRMPRMSGLEASQKILLQGTCRCILLMSMFNQSEVVDEAIRMGVLGYVLKVNAAEELIPAVRSALSGEVYLSRGVHAG